MGQVILLADWRKPRAPWLDDTEYVAPFWPHEWWLAMWGLW